MDMNESEISWPEPWMGTKGKKVTLGSSGLPSVYLFCVLLGVFFVSMNLKNLPGMWHVSTVYFNNLCSI